MGKVSAVHWCLLREIEPTPAHLSAIKWLYKLLTQAQVPFGFQMIIWFVWVPLEVLSNSVVSGSLRQWRKVASDAEELLGHFAVLANLAAKDDWVFGQLLLLLCLREGKDFFYLKGLGDEVVW